jgi:N-acetylglutamate synthase-like GNAT family acetyltransferase
VEVQLRDARLTDIDRVINLLERADQRWTLEQLNDAADVLRQMVYLPNTSLLVALDGRMLVGVAVLALRPSVVAGGLVGAVDLLVVEPGHENEGVVEALLNELIRSARNKGCVVLEGNIPVEPAELARWEAVGFAEAGPRLRCPLVRVAALSW